ncbi:MAG: stage III sporulation protein AG [Thermoanaerobacterales bacterium]|jgi:stage III sporulation protein AG|nr:stage III sporulation protein AG [Thermoanaerobacterales bacterium]
METKTNFKKLYEWIKNPKNKILPNLVLIFTIGFLLLSLNKIIPSNNSLSVNSDVDLKEDNLPPTIDEDSNYKTRTETQLAELLQKVENIGQVNVMITLENEELIETAFNIITNEKVSEERDNEGGIRTITEIQENQEVVVISKSGEDEPVVIKKTTPKIKGVLIVAEGASSSHVKEKIIRAASTLLDIPVYKISVLPNSGAL